MNSRFKIGLLMTALGFLIFVYLVADIRLEPSQEQGFMPNIQGEQNSVILPIQIIMFIAMYPLILGGLLLVGKEAMKKRYGNDD